MASFYQCLNRGDEEGRNSYQTESVHIAYQAMEKSCNGVGFNYKLPTYHDI